MTDLELGAKAVEWLLDTCSDGYTADPFDIQDFMKRVGLLAVVPYDPDKHGDSFDGAEDMSPGDDFYVPTESANRLLKVARQASTASV